MAHGRASGKGEFWIEEHGEFHLSASMKSSLFRWSKNLRAVDSLRIPEQPAAIAGILRGFALGFVFR
jgi:hypothetical protein